jgi:hypothetical protein
LILRQRHVEFPPASADRLIHGSILFRWLMKRYDLNYPRAFYVVLPALNERPRDSATLRPAA